MRKLLLLFIFLLLLLPSFSQEAGTYTDKLIKAALERTALDITYDPTYYRLDYPGGDVPADKGVCTDVVIRSYRKVGIDLQKEVHEDMKKNFKVYPDNWGLSVPDKNIDHRRVPNLMTYFSRFGSSKPVSGNASDYEPGDIVCWRLDNGMTHIGILSSKKSADSKRFLVVHNIGRGPELSDCLFKYKIIGHYDDMLKQGEL